MKLKNKKTGEITEVIVSGYPVSGNTKLFECSVMDSNCEDGYRCLGTYNSLAELNAEWEDYEEPEEWWYIDIHGYHKVTNNDEYYQQVKVASKEVGNYFDTREEAEKAVEKLKAWKQLKENCNFRFNGLERDKTGRLIGIKVEFDKAQVTFDTAKRCYEILDLLFGGEEC